MGLRVGGSSPATAAALVGHRQLLSVPFFNLAATATEAAASSSSSSSPVSPHQSIIWGRPLRWSQSSKSRFNFDNQVNYYYYDDDDDDALGFNSLLGGGGGNRRKKRAWWSDVVSAADFDDDDEEEEVGFGGGGGILLEDYCSLDASRILFKVLNAFGWILPAIAISMLLGTGTNTFLMALVLPIAQSVISFVTEILQGNSLGGSKKKRKGPKKKPFRRAQNYTETKRKVRNTREVSQDYSFQDAKNDVSSKTSNKRGLSFGGWDELDRGLESDKAPKRGPTREAYDPRSEKRGKLSRRGRTGDTPLLGRLLIAVFPFLGSWTRLL